MFIGEFYCKVDAKGRLALPVKFREQLEEPFIITRGLDNCIDLFPMETWKKRVEKLEDIKISDQKQRAFSRLLLSGAKDVEFDQQGRIMVPKALLTFANLEKDAVVIGANNRIEIWAKDKWDEYIANSLENIDEIVDDLDI